MIKNRHYRALELDKVLQLLSREASCSESQERILSMEPSTGLYEVKLLLQETDDAVLAAPPLEGYRMWPIPCGGLRRALPCLWGSC